MDNSKEFAYIVDINKLFELFQYEFPLKVVENEELSYEYLKFFFETKNKKVNFENPKKDKIFERFAYKAVIENWNCSGPKLKNCAYIGQLDSFHIENEPYTYKYETKDRIFKVKDFNDSKTINFIKEYLTKMFLNLLFVGN